MDQDRFNEAIARFDGALHLATSLGLYRLEGSRVREIESLEAPYWSLLVAGPGDSSLLIG